MAPTSCLPHTSSFPSNQLCASLLHSSLIHPGNSKRTPQTYKLNKFELGLKHYTVCKQQLIQEPVLLILVIHLNSSPLRPVVDLSYHFFCVAIEQPFLLSTPLHQPILDSGAKQSHSQATLTHTLPCSSLCSIHLQCLSQGLSVQSFIRFLQILKHYISHFSTLSSSHCLAKYSYNKDLICTTSKH